MEDSKSLKIVEICKIFPSLSPEIELSLPPTCFDLLFCNVSPTPFIFFFSIHSSLRDSILPKLKHSLSLTLSTFRPFAGNLTWPNDSTEPAILYKPGDGVSLTIAETNAEFNRLLENQLETAAETFFLVPHLQACSSHATIAPIMAIQITFFPENGFSIGVSANHFVVDGNTTALFLNSWASICKQNLLTLSLEKTPIFDRTTLKDPAGFDALYTKYFPFVSSQVKQLGLIPINPTSLDGRRCTFELSPNDIQNLRKKVENSQTQTQARYLSSFVLAFSHVSMFLIKAQKLEATKGKIALAILVDWRSRSTLPVPVNYFGNGVVALSTFLEKTVFDDEENGLAIVANKIKDSITEFEEMESANQQKNPVDIYTECLAKWEKGGPISKLISAVGSPKFRLYEVDFGWGSSKKVEMPIFGTGKNVILLDSRNRDGGIEASIALPHQEMTIFTSLFSKGLK